MNAYPDWNCDTCGRHMTPSGDCPHCAKKERSRAIAAGEIKRARDIKVGDMIAPRFSFKDNFNTVETVEITSKGKVVVNRGRTHLHGEYVYQPEQWVDVAPQNHNTNTFCSDDCDQNHCPKCGGHTLGRLESFQQCSSCELKEEQQAHSYSI